MKRFIFTLTVLLFSGIGIYAQEGVIMPDKPKNGKYVDYSAKEKGFWAGVDLSSGATIHIDDSYQSSVTSDIHFVAGYRYNCYLQAGIGVGAKIYALQRDRIDAKYPNNRVSIPLYADVRGVIINPVGREVVPCWSFDIGYSFFDGFYMSPTIGIRVGGLERHHFLAGLSYVLQGAQLVRTGGSTAPGYLHSVELKLGYQF